MIAGIGSSVVSTGVGTSRYWYGLPQWPSGQNAFSSQFDAGQYLSNLYFPTSTQQNQSLTDPAALIEGALLGSLKDLFTPLALRSEDTSSDLNQLVNSRFWPTQWPAATPQNQNLPTTPSGSDLVGQILDILA